VCKFCQNEFLNWLKQGDPALLTKMSSPRSAVRWHHALDRFLIRDVYMKDDATTSVPDFLFGSHTLSIDKPAMRMSAFASHGRRDCSADPRKPPVTTATFPWSFVRRPLLHGAPVGGEKWSEARPPFFRRAASGEHDVST
jgi:hypothetical protein